MPYKHYVCDIPELDECLEEINSSKETIINSFFTSDSNQVVIIVEGAKDLFKEKIRNLINPEDV
jgi:hypothetical protein